MRKILSLFVVLLLAGGMSACAGCGEDDGNNGNNGDDDAGMDVVEDVEDDTTEDVEEDVTEDVEEDLIEDVEEDVTDAEGDATDTTDATDAEDDVMDVEDDVMDADAGTIEPDPAASSQIETVLGETNATIEQVAVTYIKPGVGGEDPGFFVQAEQTGPALFVEVDPTAVDPDIVQGDIISFDVTNTTSVDGRTLATEIENIQYLGSGYDVSQLVQDVGSATDLVSALDDYEAEYLSAEIEITSEFGFAGGDFEAATIETAGIQGESKFLFRITEFFMNTYDIQNGCTLTVTGPMWRFNDEAQLSVFFEEDISAIDCPLAIEGASATAETEVQVSFSRPIDDSTVSAAEFTIAESGGAALNVSAASVSDNVVTLTTDAQTQATEYTITVSDAVQGALGTALPTDSNTVTFLGYAPPAEVVINELNGEVDSALGEPCDLLEIRVTSGGSMSGFKLYERESDILTFDNFIVDTDDIIVVHFDNADCNPNNATNERNAVDDEPSTAHAQNFDTAYDWYSSEGTLTTTDNVLWIEDTTGGIADVVWADDTEDAANCASASAANSTIGAAESTATASAWVATDGSTLPSTLTDEEFCNNAVLGLASTGSGIITSGDSIQRNGDVDNDHKGDWTITGPSWGELNDGQTAQ